MGGATPANIISPVFFDVYPNLAYDSWVTIGIDLAASPLAGETNVSVVQSPGQNWVALFEPGDGLPGGNIAINDSVGGVWYVLNGEANGVPGADGRVSLGQFTTDGELSGNMQVQVFPQGDNENFLCWTCLWALEWAALLEATTIACTMTRWVYVVGTARPTLTLDGVATTSMIAWVTSMIAASAMAPAPFMTVVAGPSRMEIATAMATNWTHWALAAGPVRRMPMQTAFVTTWTIASV